MNRADRQLVRKSTANSRQELVPTEEQTTRSTSPREEYTDKVAAVPNYDEAPKASHPDSSEAVTDASGSEGPEDRDDPYKCSTVAEIVDIPAPQVEENQTVGVATSFFQA